MIIGVDGNEANVREKVGVSMYTLKLLEYFQRVSNESNQFIVFLRENPRDELPFQTAYFKYRVIKGSFLWSQISLPLHLFFSRFFKNRINIFFSPAHYAPRFSFCPTVVTIHDLSYFYYPQEFLKKDLYKLTRWTQYSVFKAKKIITVSKTTKKDLIKYYPAVESKITVIYNGMDREINENSTPSTNFKSLKSQKYILYVGTLQPRKNIVTLIRAFRLFHTNHPEYKLVIAGKRGWLFDLIFKEAQDLYVNENIIFPGYVSDEELIVLYKNAFCFVLPSFYEGFGIPILESMSYGCPVIASFNSSLPEVGGDACLYIDPYKPEDIVDKLELLLKDKTLRKELIKKGKERMFFFSWTKCGKETLELLQSSV